MRVCSVDGCDKPHRARGYCTTHYNHRFQPNRHAPRKVTCTVCGTEVERMGGGGKGGARRPVCSDRCRAYLTYGRWPAGKELVGPLPWIDPAPVVAVVAPPRVRHWVSGPCAWCGRGFTAEVFGDASRYCSRSCARRRDRARRRAAEADAPGVFTWAEVMRIYVRIGGCAYCWQPSDDVQPDHVVPLSRGGSNSITNVVPACGACNRDKRDLLLHEWWPDRERRGLEPRALHPSVRHLTHAMIEAARGRG